MFLSGERDSRVQADLVRSLERGFLYLYDIMKGRADSSERDIFADMEYCGAGKRP